MAKKPDWDYALHIKGVDLKSLPMTVVAEYIKEFANLLGEQCQTCFLMESLKGALCFAQNSKAIIPAITRNRLQND
jgi:hypothetical protein